MAEEESKAKKKGGEKAPQASKGSMKELNVAKTFKNKVKHLEAHLRKFPEDASAASALASLKKAGTINPRKAPKSQKWKASEIRLAQMASKVGYNGHIAAHNWGGENVSPWAGFKEKYRSAGLGPDLSPAGRARRAAFEEALKQKAEQEKAEAKGRQEKSKASQPATKPAGKPGASKAKGPGKPFGGKPRKPVQAQA